MGTIIHLDVCLDEQNTEYRDQAYRDAWQRLEDISWRMNVYDDRSDVTKVNSSYQNPTIIGEDTYYVIQKAIEYSAVTKGAFDITVWPLLKFWREHAQKNQLPSAQDLDAIRESIGPKNIHLLDNSRVEIRHPKAKIDLGGIAKGYAIDEVARIFREHKLESFFIDAGGDIYVGGLNCQEELWKIAIRDPQDSSAVAEIVYVKDAAVTTSGNYEQFEIIQNNEFSHIINPITGYPQRSVVSATVIAPTALEADALSTALTILGQQESFKLIDKLGVTHAALIMEPGLNNSVLKRFSKEFKNYQPN